MTIREVIERILEYHPFIPAYHGCDDFKCGDPDQECSGIVCAMVPTMEVIEETARRGANLLIVHEPTFYTSADEDGWFEDFENSVYEKKREILDRHGIVIWRDHDHLHAHDPDGIFTGVLKYLGWEKNAELDADTGLFAHYIVRFEPMRLEELMDHVVNTIGLNGARFIGNKDDMVSSLAIVGHLYPMDYRKKDGTSGEYSVSVIKVLEDGVDVIMPGETIDWTVLSYIRDAVQLGKTKAMISVGHFNWEELGMRYMKDWLQELLPSDMRIDYVASGDMYQYYAIEEEA